MSPVGRGEEDCRTGHEQSAEESQTSRRCGRGRFLDAQPEASDGCTRRRVRRRGRDRCGEHEYVVRAIGRARGASSKSGRRRD